jgi:hypothetical protein
MIISYNTSTEGRCGSRPIGDDPAICLLEKDQNKGGESLMKGNLRRRLPNLGKSRPIARACSRRSQRAIFSREQPINRSAFELYLGCPIQGATHKVRVQADSQEDAFGVWDKTALFCRPGDEHFLVALCAVPCPYGHGMNVIIAL